MNLEEEHPHSRLLRNPNANDYPGVSRYQCYVNTVRMLVLAESGSAMGNGEQADKLKALGQRLERSLQCMGNTACLDNEQELPQVHKLSIQTERLKCLVFTLMALAYVETELYRLSSDLEKDFQYRGKYRKLMALSVVQLRLRIVAEVDSDEFEGYLIGLLRELRALPYGIEFMGFLRGFVDDLELDYPQHILREIVRPPDQPQQKLLISRSVQPSYNRASIISNFGHMDEEAKFQVPEPSTKCGLTMFRRSQQVNGRTLFFRTTNQPVHRRT